jgi:hypothetical protein
MADHSPHTVAGAAGGGAPELGSPVSIPDEALRFARSGT